MCRGYNRVVRNYESLYNFDEHKIRISELHFPKQASANYTTAISLAIDPIVKRISKNRVVSPAALHDLIYQFLVKCCKYSRARYTAVLNTFGRELTFGVLNGEPLGDYSCYEEISAVWIAYETGRVKFSNVELELAILLAITGDKNAAKNCKRRNLRGRKTANTANNSCNT